jgi:hypothetical protein
MGLSAVDRETLGEQVTRALDVHRTWMDKLRVAVDTGRSALAVEAAADAAACEIGRWLAYGASADLRRMSLYERSVAVHERFHREAARTLRLALLRDPGARASLADAAAFGSAAADLRRTLYDWLAASRNA